MRAILALTAVMVLAACSPQNPKAEQANADLKTAADASGSAVNNLAGATADSAKTAAATADAAADRAKMATGTAMQKAGTDLKSDAHK